MMNVEHDENEIEELVVKEINMKRGKIGVSTYLMMQRMRKFQK
jgi:hypothetical protein